VLFLLDTNVLIDANRDYYALDRVPEFWDWLVHFGTEGQVKIPIEILEEIAKGRDELAVWARQAPVRTALLLGEHVEPNVVARVTDEGYASDLTDDEVVKIGRDPFLVAYALVSSRDRCVVTTEGSRPRAQRANRHLPDVCAQFGVRSINTFELIRTLDFRTGWKLK
jgi:hypothetical protein